MVQKNRICNICDCRDSAVYAQGTVVNPLCCVGCGGQKPACHYVAHFPCTVQCAGVFIVASDMVLAPKCLYGPCQFVGSATSSFGPDNSPLGSGPHCSWQESSINAATFPWTMNISASPATFTYSLAGTTIVYRVTSAFDCYGPNNFFLVSSNLPANCQVPSAVCITPVMTPIAHTCPATSTYDTEPHRCACCDPYCDTIPIVLYVMSTGIVSPIRGTATVAQRSGFPTLPNGINSPSGPSRRFCVPISGFPNTSVCFVLYCSNGLWYVDWYCGGVFITTVLATSQCCPLGGFTGATTVTCVAASAIACMAFGSVLTTPCVATTPSCCNPADEGNCHITLTSSCAALNESIPMSPAGAHAWIGSNMAGDLDLQMTCSGGTWTIAFLPAYPCTIPSITSTNAKCTPFSGTFTTATFNCGFFAGSCGPGSTITAALSI